MNDQRLTLKTAAVAVLMIAAGLPLRFDLAQRLQLHVDEAMHFVVANEPTLADAWEASRIHTHPPLPFLLYHEWLKVGNSEWVLRLPSIAAGAIATWIAYLWLTRLTDRRAALVGVFLLTFSLPVLHVSAQMRGYTFLFAFLFGALWFHERFRESGQVRHLTGETSCLVFALLTHYASAWVIGVLGLVGLARSVRRGLGSPATRAWIVSQFVLAGGCVGLYLTHLRGFVGSETHLGFWGTADHANMFGETVTGRLMFVLVGFCRFFGAMSGMFWYLVLGAACVGTVLFSRRGFGSSSSRSPFTLALSPDAGAREELSGTPRFAWLESTLLIAGPFVFAALLQATKVYPLGGTRHSLWIMPFVVLAISAAARPLFAKPSSAWRIGIAAAGLAWAWWYPYRHVTQFTTKLTPEVMQKTVEQLRASVAREEVILTDDAGRLILAYYLGRDSMDRGQELRHGFREYHLGGYRVVAIPYIHFFFYSLRENWPSFVESVGSQSTQPLWIVCMGFEVPEYNLKSLGAQLPPSKVVTRHTVGDTHLLRVQFREPSKPKGRSIETAAGNSIGEPVSVSSRTNIDRLDDRGLTPSGSPNRHALARTGSDDR